MSSYLDRLLGTVFPNFSSKSYHSVEELEEGFRVLKYELGRLLVNQQEVKLQETIDCFFEQLPKLYKRLLMDIEAMYEGDPAAKSKTEVIRSYPGFYAISAYRIAHCLKQLGVKDIPRSITEVAHSKTGIDIHPGAIIGERFCIDHGTGVVIGETTQIGNGVKIYQGVTLGALSVDKALADTKRHPTIEDNVVIYSGATILGGETTIGAGALIGGNVWLTKSVPAGSKVYYKSQIVTNNAQKPDWVVIQDNNDE